MPGNVELFIAGENGNADGYGGYVSIVNGDFKLAIDTPDSPEATIQLLRRVIVMNARIVDQNGNPVSTADDIFNTDLGASIGARIGEYPDSSLISDIQSRILNGIGVIPNIASNPAPVVVVTDLTSQGNPGWVQIDVTVYTLTGQTITVPSMQLQVYGV